MNLRLSEKVTIGPSFYMNFFSWHFSLHDFFCCLFFPHPPAPHHFSNGPSLNSGMLLDPIKEDVKLASRFRFKELLKESVIYKY